tara:strand:+ start:1142 stop:1729 length:588 start_codon:yes stop_codon:yes gene_type:complete
MNPTLNQNLFFVKEHVGMFKAANNYDIYNPENQDLIMNCRENKLGFFTKLLRFTGYKRMTPFNVEVTTPSGEKILTVKRGVSFILSTVHVYDENEKLVGKFKQKLFSIGGKFNVLDTKEKILCKLKGKWTSWDFKFIKDNFEFGHVSKKWAGLGKEMFTSADNYMLSINNEVPENDPLRMLILSAVICIDMVLKE